MIAISRLVVRHSRRVSAGRKKIDTKPGYSAWIKPDAIWITKISAVTSWGAAIVA